MNLPLRVRAALLTVVTGALVAGCTGGGDQDGPTAEPTSAAATPVATPSPSPTPTATPKPLTAAQTAELVTNWYTAGGETAMVDLIGAVRTVEAARSPDELSLVSLDFGPLLDAVEKAGLPGTIPDAKTQTAWSRALDKLEDGANAVLEGSRRVGVPDSSDDPDRAALGWLTFDEGVKELKAAQARLDRPFGLRPSPDPWKEPR
ncbi:hypothetical protein ABZ802_26170 [Streptomyces sp. NPDC047737]|uniref:hypothetical protein n=1 Tax=unclassified Streptomyces TaxID=2593676 RepID=UPI00340B62FF